MKKTCVDCHKSHNDSAKKDWQEGDVGGALEIIRPLEADIERARQGLQGTFIGVGALSASLLTIFALVIFLTNRRRTGNLGAR